MSGLNNLRRAILALGDREFTIRDFPNIEGLKAPNRSLTQLCADLGEIEVVGKRTLSGATKPVQVYRNVCVRVKNEAPKEASVAAWADVWPGFFQAPKMSGSLRTFIQEV